MRRKGHVDTQMGGVRRVETCSRRWAQAQAQHDASPHVYARWICKTGAAGKMRGLASGDGP
jgi:hypothetical protein